HTRCLSDWSSDVCSSDLPIELVSKARRIRQLATLCDKAGFENLQVSRVSLPVLLRRGHADSSVEKRAIEHERLAFSSLQPWVHSVLRMQTCEIADCLPVQHPSQPALV